MKTKHREIFLLISYLALVITCAGGQMLCISCCDDTHMTTTTANGCCHGRQSQIADKCCGQTSQSPDFEPVGYSAFNSHGRCLCVHVPLDTAEPHDVPRQENVVSSVSLTAALTVYTIDRRMDFPVPSPPMDPQPGDLDILHTTILLI